MNLQVEIENYNELNKKVQKMGFDNIEHYVQCKLEKELNSDIEDDYYEWKDGNQKVIVYINWLLRRGFHE